MDWTPQPYNHGLLRNPWASQLERATVKFKGRRRKAAGAAGAVLRCLLYSKVLGFMMSQSTISTSRFWHLGSHWRTKPPRQSIHCLDREKPTWTGLLQLRLLLGQIEKTLLQLICLRMVILCPQTLRGIDQCQHSHSIQDVFHFTVVM